MVKTKQIPVGLGERHRQMVTDIQGALGYPTITAVLQQALIEMHERVMAQQSITLQAIGNKGLEVRVNENDHENET